MKFSFKDLDFILNLKNYQKESVQRLPDFVFDDEPLDQILYGNRQVGPEPASLYLRALECVQKIRHALRNEKIEDAVEKLRGLGNRGYEISTSICFELVFIMKKIVPAYPNPVMEFDLSGLEYLVDRIWDMATKSNNNILQNASGTVIYRWYEHHQKYESARQVLGALIEIHNDEGRQNDEAIMINNLAFEYVLEGRYEEACPLFEKAAQMFEDNKETYEFANSRANYWECRFNRGEIEGIEEIEAELKELSKILGKRTGWHARKPLSLLARIEEHRGNLGKAINLVERAIKSCENSNTRYPEMDREYLEKLKHQRI